MSSLDECWHCGGDHDSKDHENVTGKPLPNDALDEHDLRVLWADQLGSPLMPCSLIQITGSNINATVGEVGVAVKLCGGLSKDWLPDSVIAFWTNGANSGLWGIKFKVLVLDLHGLAPQPVRTLDD